jgi:hypothetical protein
MLTVTGLMESRYFYGRQVVYVPLRSICDYLGVGWSGQRQRILFQVMW